MLNKTFTCKLTIFLVFFSKGHFTFFYSTSGSVDTKGSNIHTNQVTVIDKRYFLHVHYIAASTNMNMA